MYRAETAIPKRPYILPDAGKQNKSKVFFPELIFLLALVKVPPNDGLSGTNSSQNTDPETNILPRESAALVKSPGLISKVGTQPDHTSEVGNSQRASAAIGKLGELGGQPVVGLAGIVLDLGLLGGGFALETMSLGLRLHVLIGEVGGHGVDAGDVDVDEGGGRCRVVGDDLGGRRGGGLVQMSMNPFPFDTQALR